MLEQEYDDNILAPVQVKESLNAILDTLDRSAQGLDLLAEQLGSLPGGDAVMRTAILDRISLLYADINRLRADGRNRRKSLGSSEAAAEFGAQFKLFGQAVENALDFADTPEKCDEVLTGVERKCFQVKVAVEPAVCESVLNSMRWRGEDGNPLSRLELGLEDRESP